MGMLSGVTKGKIKENVFCILYGPDGVGKSTFGSKAPNPVFLGTEKGTASLDVSRLPTPRDFNDCLLAIKELTEEKHDFKTLVIDSLDWLEPLLWRQICEQYDAKSIEAVAGGYGKGYTMALETWGKMIEKLLVLKDKMHIIALAHSQQKATYDPRHNATIDRYVLKLNDKASAKWREGVDAVLFADFETYTKEDRGRTKATGDGRRVIFTERRPAYDAKNRYGLPLTLPMEWADFYAAKERGEPQPASELYEICCVLLEQVTNEEVKAKAKEHIEKHKNDSVALNLAADRLRKVTEK